jgi:hypothetical protein
MFPRLRLFFILKQMIRAPRRILSCCPTGMGAIYEVSISFTDGGKVRDEYSHWLSNHHISEVLSCEGFVSAELLKESMGTGLVVRYTLESPHAYEKYNASEVAKRLRQDAFDKFGPVFSASRKLLVSDGVFFR